ncbi:Hypothetical protein HVR_LOCUS586 [uncultured virus]|nr:Hypothetical protein HVR_LOCUS586 [uncultured virus]
MLTLNILRDQPKNQLTLNVIISNDLMRPISHKKRIDKYTLEIFIQRATEIHGNNYDYSQITSEDIQGIKCLIPVTCRICGYFWKPSISNHIHSKRKCPSCMKQAPWTLERFLQQANVIHGNKYDYSQITIDHIKGYRSKLPITCKQCGYFWNPTIDTHIYKKSDCPDCVGHAPWTLERVIRKGNIIHNNNCDYSMIESGDINGYESRLRVRCKVCNYYWNPSIASHLTQKHGCPNCANQIPWTLERVLQRVLEIHQDKYDYSQVQPDHIKNAKSKFIVKCNGCQYVWNPSINNHIHKSTGCPNCSKQRPWTFERFLQQANEIHEYKYDYSQIKAHDILTNKSRISISCNECQYFWTPTVNGHINAKYGCPNCAKNAPWTLKRFIKRANQIHNEAFDYSQIKFQDIQGSESNVPIRCCQCNYTWNPSINSHINMESGCPNCNHSRRFSKAQISWIENIIKVDNIVVQYALSPGGEHNIKGVGRVDGFCQASNTVYEYHGNYWHGNPNIFLQNDPHPHIKGKTYGDLYQKTILRDQKIKDLGYNLIVKWETE